MSLLGGRARMPAGVVYVDQWFAGSELITTAWNGFAAIAWGSYLELGRGAVWLPADADEAAHGPMYFPASKPALLADRTLIIRKLNTDLARYKPKDEFVIFFKGARDLKAYYAGKSEEFEGVLRPAKGQMKPPQAYEQLAAAEKRGDDLSAWALTPRSRR
jgi:hypothetical protein